MARHKSKVRNDIFAVQSKQKYELVIIDNIIKDDTIHQNSVKSFFDMLHNGSFKTCPNLSTENSLG